MICVIFCHTKEPLFWSGIYSKRSMSEKKGLTEITIHVSNSKLSAKTKKQN